MVEAKKFLGIVAESTAKGFLAVGKSVPVTAFFTAFFENIYSRAKTLQAEERQNLADQLQDLQIQEIKDSLAGLNNRLAGLLAGLADQLAFLVQAFAAALVRIEDTREEFTEKIDLLQSMTDYLSARDDAAFGQINKLKAQLFEIRQNIQNDPTQLLFMPHPGTDVLVYSYQWLELTGREQELHELRKFAHLPSPKGAFRWWSLLGPGGVGKSRLALDWLQELQRAGWTTGFLRPRLLSEFISRTSWRPDRPLALVIDYGYEAAEILPEFISTLADRFQADGLPPVRLLVLDRAVSPAASWDLTRLKSQGRQRDLNRMTDTSHKPRPTGRQTGQLVELEPEPYYLLPIKNLDDQISFLQKASKLPSLDLGQDEAARAWIDHCTGGGLPLYLIILGLVLAQHGPSPISRLDWSRETLLDRYILLEVGKWRTFFGKDRLCEQFAADVGFITLAGGLPAAGLTDQLPPPLYPQVDRDKSYLENLRTLLGVDDQRKVNSLRPDLLGERFLLTGGNPAEPDDVYTEPYFDPLAWLPRALEVAPAGLGLTLIRLDQDFPGHPGPPDWLTALLDHLSAHYHPGQAAAFLPALPLLVLGSLLRGRKLDQQPWFQKLEEMALLKREAALVWAYASFIGVSYCAENQLWTELEVWGERLAGVRAEPAFAQDQEIALEEAQAAFNAISDYGAHKQWTELEVWGERLAGVRAAFAQDQEIALREAKAAVNAINHYGAHKQWTELETWGRRLAEVRAEPAFAQDREIALREAKAAVNAISHYGAHEQWTELEVWGERLAGVRAAFAQDQEIALEEAQAAFNATKAYGAHEKWSELEVWGDRLAGVRAAFAQDQEIALEEAQAAFNTIKAYQQLNRLQEIKNWVSRLSPALTTLGASEEDLTKVFQELGLNS